MKNRLLCSIFERFIVSLTCKSKIVSLKLRNDIGHSCQT